MTMYLKLVVLLSATVLTLAAPVEEHSTITTKNVEVLADMKNKSDDGKDSASTSDDNDQKITNPDESPIIKEILDKLDKSDITKVMDEELALKTKSSEDSVKISEIMKSDYSTEPSTKNVADDNKSLNTMLTNSDSTDFMKKITEETDKRLKDVASAVAEVVTSLPVPARPDTPNKYMEVIGHFITELVQIPVVLLHAVSNAIAALTNNKLTLPTPPPFLSSATQAPQH